MPPRIPSLLAPGAAALVVLCGCSSVETRVKSRLKTVAVASLEVGLARGTAIAPGEKVPLVVRILGQDGKVLVTQGEGHGQVPWTDLQITGEVLAVDGGGLVSLPADPQLSEGKVPRLTVTVPGQPGIQKALEVPVRYDVAYATTFSGPKGLDGKSGAFGRKGAFGFNAAQGPRGYLGPGGNGGDGGAGGDGRPGHPGGDGPDVEMHVALRPGPHPLLQVEVRGEARTERDLIDPQGGSLNLTICGGAGGQGGMGGLGGQGGMGGSGAPSGTSGKEGPNGQSGVCGQAGGPGRLEVVVDPTAKPYLNRLQLKNLDGYGKPGPAPRFTERVLPPLW